MERDHNNYYGQKADAFVMLSEFELNSNSLQIAFEVWKNVQSFDLGEDPIRTLKRIFVLQSNEFDEFFTSHQDVFQNISTAAINILGISEKEFRLDYLNLQIAKFVLVIKAIRKVTFDDEVIRVKTSPEYHHIIASNLELVSQAVSLAWEYGKEQDQFLNSLTDLNKLKK